MARSRWKKKHKGDTLRSGFEVRGAKFLDSMKVKYEYETLKIKYIVPESTHTYTPDFILPNGIVVEYKGRFTPQDRKKMALVVEQHPELDIRMVFMVDNTLTKKGKTTYTDWCKKKNILCHVARDGSLPDEWLVPAKKGAAVAAKRKAAKTAAKTKEVN